MKRKLSGFLVVVMIAMLSGCGLKGPLYWPPEETKVKPDTETTEVKSGVSTESASQPPVDADESLTIDTDESPIQ